MSYVTAGNISSAYVCVIHCLDADRCDLDAFGLARIVYRMYQRSVHEDTSILGGENYLWPVVDAGGRLNETGALPG